MGKLSKDGFDNIIKNNIIGTKVDNRVVTSEDFGYVINGKSYDRYYNKAVFDRFKEEMERSSKYGDLFRVYVDCPGQELSDNNGKNVPKMASVASSSRFCFLALRDGAKVLGGDKVELEKKCDIIDDIDGKHKKIATASLDAYIRESNTYVEAKCHEIFDNHSIVMSEKYVDLLSRYYGIESEEYLRDKKVILPLSIFGFDGDKANLRFDIKQLMCHLLGIKSSKQHEERARLVYMFFKPVADNEQEAELIGDVFGDLKAEISTIFGSKPIRKFTEENNIELEAIYEESKVMESLTVGNCRHIREK